MNWTELSSVTFLKLGFILCKETKMNNRDSGVLIKLQPHV